MPLTREAVAQNTQVQALEHHAPAQRMLMALSVVTVIYRRTQSATRIAFYAQRPENLFQLQAQARRDPEQQQ